MRTPPGLLGAAAMFWGWQSGLGMAGIIMAAILEGAPFVRTRWDLQDTDFERIWNFCTLLSLTVLIYAFSSNEEGGSFGGLFHGAEALHNATATTSRTASAFLRWLPLVFLMMIVSQLYSVRQRVPLTAVSLWLRRRKRREMKSGQAMTPFGSINLTYPYFVTCLFSAGIHPREFNDASRFYFVGQAALIAWALWRFRSRRFGNVLWCLAMPTAIAAGFAGQYGVWQLQGVIAGYNAQWMERLFRGQTDPRKSMTAIGEIGQLQFSTRIAVRLRTPPGQPPPAYLRQASYDNYRREVWFAGRARDEFARVPEVNQTTYVLVGGKTNTATVNIACYLNGWDQELGNPQGLVPLPTGCGRLENMYAYELQKNPEGALLADGARLLIFDADYGPGGTMDMPPGAGGSDPDLSVPTNEVPVLKQVMAENGLEGESEGQTLQNVRRFFARRFTYTLWQRPPASQRTNETPLARFLLRTHRGHCEYFATATVLLLRQMGIPARYAVGYLVPDRGRGGSYLVRDCDAHAWCLAWDANKKQWEDFDTTPFSALNAMDLLPPWQWMADMLSNGAFEFSKYRLALQRRDWRAYLLLALIPALAFLLYRILFRHGRKQQWRKMPRPVENLAWPGLDSEFYALERKLAERGAARGAGEPLAQWIEHVLRDPTPEDFRGTLRRALELHYRHRFDPNGLTALERRQLAQEAGAGLERLAELNGRHSG